MSNSPFAFSELETEALLTCLRVDQPTQKAARLANFDATDWSAAIGQARRHGLEPLLYWQISQMSEHLDIPENLLQELRSVYLASAQRNLLLYHELDSINQTLSAARVSAIPLKGAHLAELVYENIALRPMSDIDLLVQESDLEKAQACLIEIGYAPAWETRDDRRDEAWQMHLPPFKKADAAPVEIHWTLVPPSWKGDIDLSGIWKRTQDIDREDKKIRVLCPEDLLLHLATHLCQHEFRFGLKVLYDLAVCSSFYSGQIDWEGFVRRAKEWQVQRCVYLALQLASDLFGAPVPSAVLQALQPSNFPSQVLEVARLRCIGKGEEKPVHPDLVLLSSNRPLPNRLRPFLQSLFPPRHYISSLYHLPKGSIKVYFYYVVRLASLFGRYGRQAWELALGKQETREFTQSENMLNDWWTQP